MNPRAMLVLVVCVAAGLFPAAGACRREQHRTACGPRAISAAVSRLELPAVEPAEVSRHITGPGPGQAIRGLLSLPCPEAASITWPGELEASLRRHGVTFERIDGPHADLVAEASRIERAGGTGIVLLRQGGSVCGSYHYMAFPPVARCQGYYERTVFVRVWRCRRTQD